METRKETLMLTCRVVSHVANNYSGKLGDAVWRLIWIQKRKQAFIWQARIALILGLIAGGAIYGARPSAYSLAAALFVAAGVAVYGMSQLRRSEYCTACMGNIQSAFDEDWDHICGTINAVQNATGLNPPCQEITIELEWTDPD